MKRIAILAALLLGACANPPPLPTSSITTPPSTTAPASPSADVFAKIAAFTISDLQAASADAKSQTPPDITASQCYDFLAAAIPKLQSQLPGLPQGAFSAFQKARDLSNGIASANGPGGIVKSLNLACAPLVIDTQTVINKLLVLGAGTAASGGTLAPLLPVLLP